MKIDLCVFQQQPMDAGVATRRHIGENSIAPSPKILLIKLV